MKDEIKEILECMEEIADCIFTTDTFELNFEDTKILLDYITNLQQENEKLKGRIEFLEDINSDQYAKIEELEQENERLKENNSDMQEEMARTWEKCDDYKSRCEKAIDKLTIKQARFINEKDYVLDDNDLDEIMYILQNGSDS